VKVIALEWEYRMANISDVIFSNVYNIDHYNKPDKLGHQLDIPDTPRFNYKELLNQLMTQI